MTPDCLQSKVDIHSQGCLMVKSTNCKARQPKIHVLALPCTSVGPWASYLNSLCLSFLSDKTSNNSTYLIRYLKGLIVKICKTFGTVMHSINISYYHNLI